MAPIRTPARWPGCGPGCGPAIRHGCWRWLPSDLCARLLAAAPPQDTRARVPFDGTRHQYACLLLPTDVLAVVENSLQAGRRSLRTLLAAIGWLGVDFAADMRTQDAFANFNTAADFDTLTCTGQP
jgi:molybdopterin-guanine dinucleotide biosynthesis protein A